MENDQSRFNKGGRKINNPNGFFGVAKKKPQPLGLELQEDFNNVDWADPKNRQRGFTGTSTPAMDLDTDWK